MDSSDLYYITNKKGFSYSSKDYHSDPVTGGSYKYYKPTIPFESFSSLKIEGSQDTYLYKSTSSPGYGTLDIKPKSTGQFIVSTSEGLITRIEIEYSDGDDYRAYPLIDGNTGTVSTKSNRAIISQDGEWKSVIISSSDKRKSVTIWRISISFGVIVKNGITYDFDPNNKCFNVKSCDPTVMNAEILSNIDYDNMNYPVVGIADDAFSQCVNLKSVIIPDGIETIGEEAFKNCSSLNEIRIPQSLESIDYNAFLGCTSMSKVYCYKLSHFCQIDFDNMQSNPLCNGAALFIDNTEVKSLSFDTSIDGIGCYAFAGCSNIENIDLSETVSSIGINAFAGCTNLSSVTNRAITPIFIFPNIFDSQTYNGTLLVPKESIALYKNKYGWSNFHKIAAIEGPDCDFVVNGIYYKIVDLLELTCKVSYDNPYYNSYFQEEISIPETVEYNGRTFTVIGIDDNAFNGSSNLTSISLPQSIQFIGQNAFDGCTSLNQIELPNTISMVEANFADLPIKKVVLFGNGEIIPNWFKSNKSLSSIELNCTNLKSVSESAFENCQSLISVPLPNTIISLGKSAFNGCVQLSYVILPANLSDIPESTFSNCTNLKEIIFGKKIVSIDKSAFSNCSSLKQLHITSTINNIGNNAFWGCSQISTITIEDTERPIQFGKNLAGAVSTGVFSSCPLQEVYIGRDVNGGTPFNDNKTIESIVIGHLVKDFPDASLGNLPKLKTLKLGKSLTSIPSFNTCTNLEYLEIGARLSTIPSFRNCASIRTIRLHSAKPQYVEAEFANKVYTDCDLEVPKGTIEAYRSAPVWKNFFNLSEFAPEALATKLEIVSSTVSLYPNETFQLNTDLLPVNANEVFKWESSNKDAVTVDTYGEITAVKDGEAIITAKTVDGSNLSAQCKVIVKPVIQLTKIVPENDYVAITVGTSSTLNVSIVPSDATYKNLIWTSSDTNIATVTNDGIINTVNIGKCTIKIEATDGSDVTAYILVDVLPVYIQSIEIQTDKSSLIQGEQCQLNSIIKPENASIKNIKWEVLDTNVANISESGILTGIKPGKTKVYAYTTDGSNLFATKDFEILPVVASTITAQLGQDCIIDLHWSAKDYVKNAKDYNIYVSENGGDFVLWLHNTTKTSTKFKGVEGKNYRFTVTMRNNNLVSEIYDELKNASIYVTK